MSQSFVRHLHTCPLDREHGSTASQRFADSYAQPNHDFKHTYRQSVPVPTDNASLQKGHSVQLMLQRNKDLVVMPRIKMNSSPPPMSIKMNSSPPPMSINTEQEQRLSIAQHNTAPLIYLFLLHSTSCSIYSRNGRASKRRSSHQSLLQG
jgi:hypothetical protein